MKLFSWFGVGLDPQLHGVAPSPFGHRQWNLQELVIHHHDGGDVPLLEVTTVALRDFQDLPESAQTSGTVAPVALVIAVAQAVLLLGFLYYFQYLNAR